MNDPIVDTTTQLSIYVQIIVGLIDLFVLTVNVPEKHICY